jgi:SSS family solute:Na+ symporter
MHNNWLPFADWSQVPFLDRMGWVFLICVSVMVVLGYVAPSQNRGMEIDVSMFKTHRSFAVGAFIVISLIVMLYTYFW